jgi:hypothetical protein
MALLMGVKKRPRKVMPLESLLSTTKHVVSQLYWHSVPIRNVAVYMQPG